MAADATARRVLRALGREVEHPSPLGTGLASDAWRVRSGPAWWALRIARDRPGAGATYPMEHAVMAELARAGARVPRPVRGSWQLDGWTGPAFSVTTGLEGAPLAESDRLRAAPALAAFLRVLHAQPVSGFGAVQVDGGALRGEQSSMPAGLMAWARRPLWPLGHARLEDHAALADRPHLRERLQAHAPVVRAALESGTGVLVHPDLHEENILDAGGEIGVIDFGEALIAPAAWEFAAVGYFTDDATADATLSAYAADDAARVRLRADSTAIGLCFGVHRWAHDGDLSEERDAFNDTFLRRTLARM
ncbi:phosphotransferase family protein [Microbacterium memoriense]|uniref:Aminoglycoside phosphotransferase family protein n=1 Tax=Microbacterium memoriense TaxID=2978350 RepID=A0ABT2PEP2_9MICO|nr:aminoglycoside phosphotransferase family protein [Microbacterium memoriense]MCT9003049.1 aminoglycoside phosphotransferase family protein [Microbacterium memoriense]